MTTFLLLATLTAQAEPVRTLDGQRIETEDYLVVPFSMADHESVEVLRELSGHQRVLALSLDGAGERSQLHSFLRSQGIELTVACDPTGELRAGPPAERGQTPQLLLALDQLEEQDRALAAAN